MMERMLLEYLVNSLWQAPLLALGAWLGLRAGRPGPRVQHRVWVAALALMVALPLLSLRSPAGSADATASMAVGVPVPDLPGAAALVGAGMGIEAGSGSEIETGIRSRTRAGRPVVGFYAPPVSVDWTREAKHAAAPAGAFPERGKDGSLGWLRMRELRLSAAATQRVVELYLAVVAFAMMRLLWSWMVARRMVAEATPAELSAAESALLEACCARMQVRRPRVLVSARTASPLVVGVVRPVLLLPESFVGRGEDSEENVGQGAKYSLRELEAVWWHELAHVSRRDYLANLVCRIWALPVAYHPATYAVERRVRQTREMVCDRMAAEQMRSPVAYARCLVGLAQRIEAGQAIAVQMQGVGLGLDLFGGGVLEERVMELIETKAAVSLRVQAVRLAGGVAMLLAAVGASATFHVRPAVAQARMAQTGAAGLRADSLALPVAAGVRVQKPMVAPEPVAAELAEMLPLERVVPVPLAGGGAEAQAAPASGRLVILFLDGLNTSLEEQVWMRRNALNYVDKTMVPGTRVAVFGLWDKLSMVQDFTSDAATLDAAISSTIAGFDPQRSRLQPGLTEGERQQMTLEAMAQLPKDVVAVDGKKTVLFFTSTLAIHGVFRLEEMRETRELLAAAEIAVYAVNVDGLSPLPSIPDAGQPAAMNQAPVATPPQKKVERQGAEVLCPLQVVGNQRIPTDSVLNHLWSRQGNAYDAATVKRDEDGLLETGYFSAVRIERVDAAKCVQLVVHVEEKADASIQAKRVIIAMAPQRTMSAQIAAAAPPMAKGTYRPGIEILSNTEGVEEFMGYISRLSEDIKRNWEPLIPEEVRAPLLKKGVVGIRFTILPDGTVVSPMVLENRSGDVALDKAAWYAIVSEGKFEPLPKEFHGPKLELRMGFFYNTLVPEGREGGEKAGLGSSSASPARSSSGQAAVREVSYKRASALAQADSDQTPGDPVRVSAAAMASNLIRRPDPVYPPIALAAHVQGAVVMDAWISKSGTVQRLSVASGPAMLQASALNAVREWTYRPYLLNGAPVDVVTTVTVNFAFGNGTVLQMLPGQGQSSDQSLYESALAQSRAGYYAAARVSLRTLLAMYPESSLLMVARLAIADSWYLEGTPAALAQAAEEYRNFVDYYPAAPEAAKARTRLAEIAVMQKKVGSASGPGTETANGSLSSEQRVPSGTMVRLLVSRPDPVYPAEAKAEHVQGSVVLDAVISKEGTIERLKVVSGPEMLQANALDAVRRWTYRPYLVDGAPVEVETTITVNFTFGL